MVEFDLDRCVTAIIEGGYRNVALQFPDELLGYSGHAASYLTEKTDANIFVLADTAYGSCCVDEVAAEHGNADFILHFGNSCQSGVSRLPVLYEFGKSVVNIPAVVLAIVSKLEGSKTSTGFLLYDVRYDHAANDIALELSEKAPGIAVLRPMASSSDAPLLFGRGVPNDHLLEQSECAFFLGPTDSALLYNIVLRFPRLGIFCVDPETGITSSESASSNRIRSQRYSLVERVRKAKVIGILVGNIAIKGYLDSIEKLKRMCRLAGRQVYVFAIGKVNVAKLCNFEGVDVYCYIACHETMFLDSASLLSTVVTPYELINAISDDQYWSSQYETELPKLQIHVADNSASEPNKSHELTLYNSGRHMLQRSFNGLHAHSPREQDYSIHMGATGTSQRYTHEPNV